MQLLKKRQMFHLNEVFKNLNKSDSVTKPHQEVQNKKLTYSQYLEKCDDPNFVSNITSIPPLFVTDELVFKLKTLSLNWFAKIPFYLRNKKYSTWHVLETKSLFLVPEKYKTTYLCLLSISYDYTQIDHVPKEMLTYSFYEKAINKNGKVYYKLPHNLKNDEKLALKAIKDSPDLFDESLAYNEEICLEAITFAENWNKVPVVYRNNKNFLKKAIESNVLILKYLNINEQTPDICLSCLNINPNLYKHVQIVPDSVKNSCDEVTNFLHNMIFKKQIIQEYL